jgi:hypothetical protein
MKERGKKERNKIKKYEHYNESITFFQSHILPTQPVPINEFSTTKSSSLPCTNPHFVLHEPKSRSTHSTFYT